ncbi:phage head-tail connector protein [Lactococcus insecticola]|uniref:Uncharacterized protein n=1 Tax=Pseudolactococcus insecticola TaxID=2709158 RepID=A0A6A0B7T6_9LACT|nr:phage head-tail connector protein [Lactococcus insecticola]GFH39847.1 hypothetical protein Hs20B_02450 [Lactococcus insecticola]
MSNEAITPINYDAIKDDLMLIVGIDDGEDDSQLRQAYRLASGYLYALVAGEEVDTVKFEALAATALSESAVYRFNRLSEEGMSQRTQDGESITWESDPMEKWAEAIKATIRNKIINWKLIMVSTIDQNERYDLGYRVPLLANGTWYYTNTGRLR